MKEKKKSRTLASRLSGRRSSLSRSELESILTFTKGLARASGSLALSYYGRANPALRFDQQLVTEADLVVQDYIRDEISHTYPDHSFLGEESSQEKLQPDKAFVWVVDPVDGTASFSAGMPIWGVSICLLERGQPVVAVFYQPVTGELYSAAATGQAMLNDRPIQVREQEVDDEALLLTYSRFHSDYLCNFPGKVRSLGSSAAHLCYLARGAATAVVLGNVHLWDVAAGALIVEAAGGELRDEKGKAFQPMEFLDGRKIDRLFLAAPTGLHQEIFRLLEKRTGNKRQ